MKIGLLGFGTIGAGVYELIKTRPGLEIAYVVDIREIGIPELTHRFEDILEDPGVDTVVEVLGGLHPAYEWTSAALKAGKNVVTANKYLVATYYDDLLTLAAKSGATLRCTAAVGGGIGWLTALERLKRLEPVVAVEGIMNGTTNYILSNMTENGLSFETALSEAQALGYAEADPSADIDGKDILHKLLLSLNVAFDLSADPEEIPCFGIRNITAADIEAFRAEGLTCKMLGAARLEEGRLSAHVQPSLLKADNITAAVPSNFNLISYEGAATGRMSFYGQGAGRYPTAANVVQDCIDLQEGKRGFYSPSPKKARVENDSARFRYYLRAASGKAAAAAERKMGPGALTKPLSVKEFCSLAEEIRLEDPHFFAAAVIE